MPSSLVLSVGTESTMKERHEKEYKFKVQRLKAALKYKGEVNPKVWTKNFGVHFTLATQRSATGFNEVAEGD